jgi:tetratricopeptide (TPR) repeat protein
MPSLAVRPFTRSAQFDQTDVDLQAVGRELHAANLVTGQYYRAGDELRLTLEAIEVASNRVMWRESVNVPADDLIALRQQVGGLVREVLAPLLGAGTAREGETAPKSDQAYELYLRSLALPSDPEPNTRAITMLRDSVALDADYAPAWSELGYRLNIDAQYSGGGRPAFQRSQIAIQRALQLDPDLIPAATRQVGLIAESGHSQAAVEAANELVLRRPESALAYFARSYALRYGGLVRRSIADCEEALRLDPTNPRLRSCALSHAQAGDFERALVFLDLDRGSQWYADLMGHLLLMQSKPDEALESFRGLPRDYLFWTAEGQVLEACLTQSPNIADLAQTAEGLLLVEPDPEIHYLSAQIMATCGQREIALRLLRHAHQGSYCFFPAVDNDASFDSLRDDPEFLQLREQAISCRELTSAAVRR